MPTGVKYNHSALKTKGSLLDQHKRPAELVACQLQTFGDTQQRSQTEWRDTFIASVDPRMPLIEKHGYLNGQECERILKKLELLQDEGKFAEHERLVTACIRRFADEENPDMELAANQRSISDISKSTTNHEAKQKWHLHLTPLKIALKNSLTMDSHHLTKGKTCHQN